MVSIARAAAAAAAVLVREGVDYAQSKAVFKAAREKAGLRASPERRGGVDRLTVEEGGVSPNPRKVRRRSRERELSLQKRFSGRLVVATHAKARF